MQSFAEFIGSDYFRGITQAVLVSVLFYVVKRMRDGWTEMQQVVVLMRRGVAGIERFNAEVERAKGTRRMNMWTIILTLLSEAPTAVAEIEAAVNSHAASSLDKAVAAAGAASAVAGSLAKALQQPAGE